MKSNSISLEDELKAQDKRCRLLLILEWISFVCSGGGTILAFLTKEAVFAATPLTVSLFLNILSRSNQDKRVYDQSSQNLIELQRQSASKIQGVRNEFLGMSFSEDGADGATRFNEFEELASKVKQLESFLEIQGGDYYSQGGAINQEVSILRNHQLEMAEAIENLTNQMGGSVEHVDQSDILDHLDRLSAAVYELEQKTATISQPESSDMESISPLMSGGETVDVTSQLEPLQSQMSALEERMNFIATADPAYDPDALQHTMESYVTPLRNQISELESQVQAQNHHDSNESHQDGGQAEAVQQQISVLQEKLDNSLAQISADVNDFQNSLNQTHEQVAEVHQRMNSLQDLANETAAANRPEAIQQQIATLNSPLKDQFNDIQIKIAEFGQIRNQLEHVQSLAQQSVDQSNPEALQARVTAMAEPLMSKISAVEETVQVQLQDQAKAQASNQDIMGKLHQVIEPLQSHMVSLEQRINQISSEGDRTPLLQKIAALQGQLQTLEGRLEAVPPVMDHSTQLNQLTTKVADMQSQLERVSTKVTQDLTAMPQMIEKSVEDKESILSELQSLSFEEELSGKKQETESELDDLLNTLQF